MNIEKLMQHVEDNKADFYKELLAKEKEQIAEIEKQEKEKAAKAAKDAVSDKK